MQYSGPKNLDAYLDHPIHCNDGSPLASRHRSVLGASESIGFDDPTFRAHVKAQASAMSTDFTRLFCMDSFDSSNSFPARSAKPGAINSCANFSLSQIEPMYMCSFIALHISALRFTKCLSKLVAPKETSKQFENPEPFNFEIGR